MDPADILREVAQQVSGCRRCILHNTRKRSVPGEGPADAQIMFIGEGPGFHENEQGRPFVGQAGKLLEDLLGRIGLKREQVFIANVVKCRPPGNRDPLPDELFLCGEYLERQVEAINPKVIVTLGRFSMARYLPNLKISAAHGRPMWVKGRLVVPMYHPAAALHQPAIKPDLERDFLRLPEHIETALKAGKTAGPAASIPPPGTGRVPAAQPSLLSPSPHPAEQSQADGEPTQLKLF